LIRNHGIFLISHPVCQYSVNPGIAHARSETEDDVIFKGGLSVLLGHSWDRAHARSETNIDYIQYTTKETASLGLSPYL
jgi:hypothetical protein